VSDARRTKPRVQIVLTDAEHATGRRLAEERGVSLSALLGMLIREEDRRARRRAGQDPGPLPAPRG
jgi:hypothetical protein